MLPHFLASAALVASSLTAGTAAQNVPFESGNWSGYALQGGPFTEIAGTFTVPAHPSGTGYFSDWIGIDGFDNSDLIQTGVEVNSVSKHTYSYNAWWEILPSAEQNIEKITVHPGDTVSAYIRELGSNEWLISITDGAQTWSNAFNYNGPANSAEYIVEAPEVGGGISSMLPYGTVHFSQMTVDGRAALLDDVWCVQGQKSPLIESVPEAVPNARTLMDDGFDVVYSGE